jgi:dTDP-4-dehydrorhamnose reductase
VPDAAVRILLFGATGQVGHALLDPLGELGEVIVPDRREADFSRPDSLRPIVRRYAPTAIVNAAAYTAVDRAESDAARVHDINARSPAVLAAEAEALGALLVHYSTDYVFDGKRTEPYEENDTPNPLSVYGRSKLDGECAVAAGCRRHLIFRTSWVMGAYGTNFLRTMLRLAAERDSLRVVADQVGAPTSTRVIAAVTAVAMRAMLDVPAGDPRWGVYHLTSSGASSWHRYARYVIEQARRRGVALRAAPDDVVPITTAEYPVAAVRPANSRMSTIKLRSTFGVDLPDWHEVVDAVLDELQARPTS